MDVFQECKTAAGFLAKNEDSNARNTLIRILDYCERQTIPYTPVLNHLLRHAGLYPYLDPQRALWQDQLVHELFKVDVGGGQKKTLHIKQSELLKALLDGKNIAVSAPTSFGKSFVIDAFIALKNPSNIALIVPTIALTDETRRRLHKKFARNYRIITTPDVELAQRNIFIFPQERALNYIEKIERIDILIVDEFYKASSDFDRERAPALIKTILELGKKAKQKYYLSPNISSLVSSPFTKDMEFMRLDFNTVFTEIHELYKGANSIDDDFKEASLLKIIQSDKKTKSLIYAGTFKNIDTIVEILSHNLEVQSNPTLEDFSDWLKIHYHPQYILSDIVRKGTGVHNGRLHRSLSQIQIKLFEEHEGINNLVSTSSIIEGVNTAAENVILWANKSGGPGGPPLNDFTYKNIIGRGGRMFRHFIGKIYLLEEPPAEENTQLSVEFTEDLLNSIDEKRFEDELTPAQIDRIIEYKQEMSNLVGGVAYEKLLENNLFQSCKADTIKKIARSLKYSPNDWKGLSYLNSNIPTHWEKSLYQALRFAGQMGDRHQKIVVFIKADFQKLGDDDSGNPVFVEISWHRY